MHKNLLFSQPDLSSKSLLIEDFEIMKDGRLVVSLVEGFFDEIPRLWHFV